MPGGSRDQSEKTHDKNSNFFFTLDMTADARHGWRPITEGASSQRAPHYRGCLITQGAPLQRAPHYRGHPITEGAPLQRAPHYRGRLITEGASSQRAPRNRRRLITEDVHSPLKSRLLIADGLKLESVVHEWYQTIPIWSKAASKLTHKAQN